MRSSRGLVALYGLASFGSLGLEVVFFKASSLAFGFDLPAAGTVLFVYLLGTAVGAVSAAGLRRRLTARRLFVLSQALLALLALSAPPLFSLAEHAYVVAASGLGGLSLHVLRVASVAAAMAPVAVVAGVVFPALAREAKWLDRGTSFGLSRLYVLGTVASAAGAWVAAVWLLPEVGTYSSMYALGAWYGALALVTLGIAPADPDRAPAGGEEGRAPGRALGLALVLGASLFVAEVVWFQLLWQTLDPTPYVTGTVLATLVLAMGAGAWLLGSRLSLSTCLLVAVGGTAFTMLCGETTPRWLATQLSPGTGFARYLATAAAAAAGVFGLAALGHGASIAALLTELRRGVGSTRAASLVSAYHAAGGALGALLASFVLVEALGIAGALVVSTVLLAAGVVALGRTGGPLGAGAVAISAVALFGHARAPESLPNGVIFHREDATGVTQVLESASGHRTLVSNRLRQEGGDAPEQAFLERLQGYLTLVAHPAPRRVLAVGLGTGIALAPLAAPEVESLTAVEISPAIVEAARYFEEANRGVLDDDRLRLVVGDGRGFLKRDQGTYDLVFQDLFFPYASGGSSLYTLEHYRHVRDRLRPGGMAVQWVSLGQMGFRELRVLLATFQSVFPETHLFLAGGYLGILGSESPLALDLDRLGDYAASGEALEALSYAPVKSAEDLLGFYLDGPRGVSRLARGAPIQTDDRLRIEYGASRLVSSLNTPALTVANLHSLSEELRFEAPELRGGNEALRRRAVTVLDARKPLVAATLARAQGDLEEARASYARVLELHPGQPQARRFVYADALEALRSALGRADLEAAERHARRAIDVEPDGTGGRLAYGMIRAGQGRHREAIDVFVALLSEERGLAAARYNLGLSLYALGDYERAQIAFEGVLAQEPDAIEPRFHLGNTLARLGAFSEASAHYRSVLSVEPTHDRARSNLASVRRAESSSMRQ